MLLIAQSMHGLDAFMAGSSVPVGFQQQFDGGQHAALQGNEIVEFAASQATFTMNGIDQAALLGQ